MTWDCQSHCAHCPWWWAIWTVTQPNGEPFINTDGKPATMRCGPFHDEVVARKFAASFPNGPDHFQGSDR